MADRVLFGNIDTIEYGLLVSQSGVDVKSAALNQLIFDSRNPSSAFPIYKIYDVTVSAGTTSGGKVVPGSFTTTHTSGGLGYIPWVLGFWKDTSTTFYSDRWLIIDSINGSPSTPAESGFVWEVTDTALTVKNYFTTQETFRIVIFKVNVSGGSGGSTLSASSLSETSGYRSDRGWVLEWTGVSGATGYRLDIATDSGFSTFPTLDQTYNNFYISGGGTTSRTITSALATTDYYIRIRADDGTTTGPDSNVVALATDATTAPIINYSGGSPLYQDGSTFTPSFSISNGGVGCDVSFSDNSAAISPSSITNVQEDTTISNKSWTSLPRSGTATQCTITATIGSNSDIETINVFRPSVDLGATISIADTEVTPTDSYAGIRLDSDGRIFTSTSGTYSALRDYVSPQNSSAAALYEAQITSVSGTTPTGPSAGSWVALTSDRTWFIQRTSDTAGTTSSSFTLEIRPTGGSVLDSVSVNLSAEVTAAPATFDLSSLNGDRVHQTDLEGGAASTAAAGVNFNTDGTLSAARTGDTTGGNDTFNATEWWDAAPSSGVGTGKYVRFEKASGGTNASWTGPALDAWHEITTTRTGEITITDTVADGLARTDLWTIDVWVNSTTSKTGAESAQFTLQVSAERIF